MDRKFLSISIFPSEPNFIVNKEVSKRSYCFYLLLTFEYTKSSLFIFIILISIFFNLCYSKILYEFSGFSGTANLIYNNQILTHGIYTEKLPIFGLFTQF